MSDYCQEAKDEIFDLQLQIQSLQNMLAKNSFILQGGTLVIPEGTEIGYLSVLDGASVCHQVRH